MANDPVRDGLLQTIEARADIGGRYLRPVRVGTAGGDGHFSLVFSATDSRTGRRVAIKVFRPDHLIETYRFQCFCQEAVLLEELAGTPNVLGWVGAKDEFVEQVQTTTGIPFDLRFPYFAVELASTDVASILRAYVAGRTKARRFSGNVQGRAANPSWRNRSPGCQAQQFPGDGEWRH